MTEWWDSLHNDPRATQPIRRPHRWRPKIILLAVCICVALTSFSIDVLFSPIKTPSEINQGN